LRLDDSNSRQFTAISRQFHGNSGPWGVHGAVPTLPGPSVRHGLGRRQRLRRGGPATSSFFSHHFGSRGSVPACFGPVSPCARSRVVPAGNFDAYRMLIRCCTQFASSWLGLDSHVFFRPGSCSLCRRAGSRSIRSGNFLARFSPFWPCSALLLHRSKGRFSERA